MRQRCQQPGSAQSPQRGFSRRRAQNRLRHSDRHVQLHGWRPLLCLGGDHPVGGSHSNGPLDAVPAVGVLRTPGPVALLPGQQVLPTDGEHCILECHPGFHDPVCPVCHLGHHHGRPSLCAAVCFHPPLQALLRRHHVFCLHSFRPVGLGHLHWSHCQLPRPPLWGLALFMVLHPGLGGPAHDLLCRNFLHVCLPDA